MNHLHGIFEYLFKLLFSGTNQFASGGLLLMAIGSIGAALRNVPLKMWHWFLGQTSLHVTILDTRDAYDWFKWWFYQQKYSRKSRRVDVENPYGIVGAEFLPAPGRHWFMYHGRPIKVVLTRDEGKEAFGRERKESITISTIGRNQMFLRNLVEEMRVAYNNRRGKRPMLFGWSSNENYWRERTQYNPRPLSSVFMPNKLKEDLVADIKKFLASEDWYMETGVPYHRGYLLYGLPGSGKTSLIAGIAAEFQSRVYYLRLSELNDGTLTSAMRAIPKGSMIVMEDVDCINATAVREETKQPEGEGLAAMLGVSLSGLLNALDGVYSPIGAMYFMTTNHIDKLDPALIRPGRIDVRVLLDKASTEQLVNMYQRFFPGSSETDAQKFITDNELDEGCVMAEFQERLLRTF
jgi:chaperone BCS1